MRTETGILQYWNASRAWRGIEVPEGTNVQSLFRQLEPLEIQHQSFSLAKQAQELSDLIVRFKRSRCPKPRKKLTNLVQLETVRLRKAMAA